MPGRKQEGQREALLRNSLESSSSTGPTGHLAMVQAHTRVSRLVETETPIPNTVSSVQIMCAGPEETISRPEQYLDTMVEDGTLRYSVQNLQSPNAVVPNPSPPRLSLRQPMSAHPLSLDVHPTIRTVADVSSSSSDYLTPTAPRQGSVGALGRAVEIPCARSASGLQVFPEGSGGFAPECRICLLSEPPGDLVAPCHCTGSLAYAHMTCLKTWVIEKRSVYCELCGAMYKEPYGSELAASIPPAPPPPLPTNVRRITSPDGQPIIIMPVGVNLGPGGMGPLLEHHRGGPHSGGPALAAGMTDPREPQSLCEWRNMWSYALILLLLLFAIIYVTVISKKSKSQEQWMMTLWQVLLVVLPIYLVLRVAFDLYRHRLAQQLAAANLQAMAIANLQANEAADAAAAAGQTTSPQREVIITRAGNRLLVVQRLPPV